MSHTKPLKGRSFVPFNFAIAKRAAQEWAANSFNYPLVYFIITIISFAIFICFCLWGFFEKKKNMMGTMESTKIFHEFLVKVDMSLRSFYFIFK